MKKTLLSSIIFSSTGPILFSIILWIFKNVSFDSLIPTKEVEDSEEALQCVVDSGGNEKCGEGRKFEFRNGDVVEIVASGIEKFVLDGGDIVNMESISDISISPDQNTLCFIVHTLAPEWLYLYNLESGILTKIDTAKNCFWSLNGSYIAYNSHTTDVGPIDVLVYDMGSGKIINLTDNLGSEDWMFQCENVGWISNDDIAFSCSEVSTSDVFVRRVGDTYIYNAETGKNVREP